MLILGKSSANNNSTLQKSGAVVNDLSRVLSDLHKLGVV